MTFAFTLSQLNLWAKTGYSSGSTVIAPNNIVSTNVTGNTAVAFFAFTSTSQTSNGDIAGVNDRTTDLTQSWSDLGLIINTTLDNLGSGAPASPTVNALTTADTTPVVTGTAKLPAGDTLTVTVNGVSYTPTLTQVGTTDSYTWAVQVTTPLAAGTYQVVATTSRTVSGSTLTASDLSTNELVINTSIPDQTPTIISYADDIAPQTGDFGNGSRTNDLAPLLKGVLDAPLDAGDVVRIYRSTDNGAFGTYVGLATVSGTSWTYQDSSLVNGSSYTYKAVVYDGSNEGTVSGLFTLNIDTTSPTVTLTIANYTDNVGTTGDFGTGTTTDDSTPQINGTFSTTGAVSPLTGGEKIEVYRDNVFVGYGQLLPTVDPTSGSITGYTWLYQESELNNGTYSYKARIVDGAGNTGSYSSNFSLTVNQPLDVNDITVNEASSYAVFTVTGTASTTVTLALTAGTATSGTDYSASLEWSSNGTTWNSYSSGVTLSGFTSFYVRTAITNDATYEGAETFKLTATSGSSASGTATIKDDGTGLVYTGTVTGGVPDTSGTADDDRTVGVSPYSATVNEGSDYAFFTVTGVANELIKLDLLDSNDGGALTANIGTNPNIYYSVNGGVTWAAYTGAAIGVPSGGSFKVRVDITAEQDTAYEGTETFQLKAFYSTNTSKSATGQVTINDAGTGSIYLPDGTVDSVTAKDNDTPPPSQTVVISAMTKDTGSSSTDFITKDGTANRTVTGTISAVLGANEVVQVSFDGGTTWSTATTTGTSWTIDDSGAHAGNWTLKARVTNTSNSLSGTSATQAVTLDTTAPTPTITLDANITTDDIVNATEASGNVSIGGAVTGASNGDTVTLTINGATYTGTVSSGRFSISVPGSALTGDSDKVIDGSVSSTDVAGNTGTATDTEGYTVDTTAPAPTITLAANITADDIVNAAEAGGNISVTGTVGGDAANGDTVTLTINGTTYTGTVVSGGFSISVPGSALVADSDKVIDASISKTDAAGNTGTGTDTEGYTVDTTAPGAPTLDLLASSDSGTSSTDDKTNDTTPTIRVSLSSTGAVAGDVVKLMVGATQVGTATLGAGDITAGYVDITASTQTQGVRNFTATITDVAGNASSASAALPVTIDATAPALSSAAVNGATLTLHYSETTTDLASTTPATGDYSVSYTFGGSTVTATVSSVAVNTSDDTVALTLASAIPGTATNVLVSYTPGANKVEDIAGNQAASFSNQAVTNASGDVTPPLITGPSGSAGDATSSRHVNENMTGTIHTFTANETVSWTLDTSEDQAKFSIDHTTGALTFLASPDYENPTDGSTTGSNSYIVKVKAEDLAGNTSTQTVTIYVDDLDEVLTVGAFDMTDATDSGSSQTDEYTSNGLPVLTFTGEAGLTITLKGPDNTTLTQGTQYSVSYAGGTYTVTLLDAVPGGSANPFGTYNNGAATGNSAATADGTYTILAVDGAGNSGTVGTFEINTAMPAQSVVISSMTKDTGSSATDFITSDGTATRTVSGTIGASLGTNEIVQVSFDGGSTWSTATTSGTSWSINDGGAHAGNWVIKARVTNTLNGLSGTAATQSVTLDTTAPAPVVTLDANITADDIINASEAGGTVAVAGGVTGANTGDTVTLTINGTTYTGTLAAGGRFSINVPGSALTGDSDKVIDASVSTTDAAGNSGTGTDTEGYTVDTTAPQITGPSGSAGAAVSSKTINENISPAHLFTANETVSWSLVGGEDQGKFTINSGSGQLSFVAAPDYENPTDGATSGSNSYVVQVRATDTAGNAATQTVTINIADVNESAPAPSDPAPLTVAFDMTDATDSGSSADDEYTSNGHPVLTFSGNAGLTIALAGPNGTTLVLGQHYSVAFNATTGVYTVTLLDAVPGGAANPFGSYLPGGTATGNPGSTGDGLYTIRATDSSGITETVGTFTIDTAPPAVPTVNSLTTLSTTPVITGTATVAAGETLKVTVNGYTYVEGDGYLSSDHAAKTWSLAIPQARPLGIQTYSVTATVVDDMGNYATDLSTYEVRVTSGIDTVYTVRLATGDKVYTKDAVEAAALAKGTANVFEGSSFDDAGSAGIKMAAYHNSITDDTVYAPNSSALPYACYMIESGANGFYALAPSAAGTTGAVAFHLYLDAKGMTQIMTTGEASTAGLSAQGYRDLGTLFSATTSNAFKFDAEAYLVANRDDPSVKALVQSLSATYKSSSDAGFIEAVEQHYLLSGVALGLTHGTSATAADLNAAYATYFII